MERPGCRSPPVVASSLLLLLLLLGVAITALVRYEPLPLERSVSPHVDVSDPPHGEFESGENKTIWRDIERDAFSNLKRTEICSKVDLSVFSPGRACGSPLSAPCFDSTRCASLPRPTIYVYDHSCSLADSSSLANATDENPDGSDRSGAIWRTAVADAGLLAEKYESACFFLHARQRVDEDPCASGAPLWNKGSNHVMVDLTDRARDSRPNIASSLAMEAAVNVRTCFYRSGYDISIPLSPRSCYPGLATLDPLARQFFLAVKGTVYVGGGGGSAERMSLVPLHDPDNGVAVVMHCLEAHGDHLKPENVDYCHHLSSTYEDYSYDDIMNTTFALVPAGRSPASFRLGEVMSAGAIPVFVATSTIRPFAEEFDWEAFSFVFSPDQVGSEMVKALRAVPREELEIMQRKSLEAYEKLFGNSKYRYGAVARNVVEVLERRLLHHRK